jgi:hypothetical protein
MPIGQNFGEYFFLIGYGKKNAGKIYCWIPTLDIVKQNEDTDIMEDCGFIANSFVEFIQSMVPCNLDDDDEEIMECILGDIVRDLYGFWHSEPVPIPFYNNEMTKAVFVFDPDTDPSFLDKADKALANFLKLDDKFRLTLSEEVSKYAKIHLDAWDYKIGDIAKEIGTRIGLKNSIIDDIWLDDFVAGKKQSEAVWDMVGNMTEIFVAKNRRDKNIYVAVTWRCLWDEEHNFIMSFKKGKEFDRVDAGDGIWEDCDAPDY